MFEGHFVLREVRSDAVDLLLVLRHLVAGLDQISGSLLQLQLDPGERCGGFFVLLGPAVGLALRDLQLLQLPLKLVALLCHAL